MFIDPAAGFTSAFPVYLSRVTLVWESAVTFQSGLLRPSLRRPRTFLVVVKHNAMKNPVTNCAENQSICVWNCVGKHAKPSDPRSFRVFYYFRRVASVAKLGSWSIICILGMRLEPYLKYREVLSKQLLHLCSCLIVLLFLFLHFEICPSLPFSEATEFLSPLVKFCCS